ncbi:MAG: DUF2207 domain-containing protein, partial [Atopobiaceae bacterium]|nr:DUF2207 domain-containing protein [Atopobiaceae bacterium]
MTMALIPRIALARDYSIDKVDIEATVSSDGSLSVKEVREFDFDGSFHGVYWKIPTGTYEGRTIETTISSVGEIINGEYVPFEESYSGADHTYQLTEGYDYIQVKLYSAHEDESAQFGIVYTDTNVATRYDDVSELYWKFVSEGWDVESRNVNCTVHLPIASGEEVVPESNVRAWGHGPLDAELHFSSNGDIICQVPGVGSSEFAEVRIVFPSEWLSGVQSRGGNHLQEVLEEEQRNADEANARRRTARMIMSAAGVAGVGIPVASLLYAAMVWSRYKQTHKPQFDDKYFRDVPSDDHPAVLGTLYNGGNVSEECLTAALMRLTDQKEAKLELVKYRDTGLFGREKVKEDYCLTPLKFPQESEIKTASDRVDFETMRYLFTKLARLTARVDNNQDCLYFGSLEKAARKYPETYDSYRKTWEMSIENECDRRGFFVDETTPPTGMLIFGGVINIFLAIASFIGLIFLDAPFFMIFVIPILFGLAGGVFIALAVGLNDISREAIELKAKLKALKRWLEDFTRLEEAIPQDVVLWNRLLVMATVLGVSEKVIEQLRTAAPQILEDTRMAPVYGWYYTSGPSMPARSFTDAVASAHSVSTSQLASSSDSSSGGGGGGFSGGGGGGFGGGGGGGAF